MRTDGAPDPRRSPSSLLSRGSRLCRLGCGPATLILLYHVAILPRDSLNLSLRCRVKKRLSDLLVTPTCEHVNNRTYVYSHLFRASAETFYVGFSRMNRVLSGAWGMHRFADAQSRDSVDIAACKRDDYHGLILLTTLILLVHLLRGRVLYYFLLTTRLCRGKTATPSAAGPISWLR